MADRYVLEHGPAGPRIHDLTLDIYAPFTTPEIAKDVTERLNDRKPCRVLWVSPPEISAWDESTRAAQDHGNG